MRHSLFFIIFFSFLTHFAVAQTKWIAHKSHSGNAENFGLITPGSAFEDDGSNFGRAPEPTVTMAQLDTVIRLSERVAVMITSEYCQERQIKTKKRLWSAGRDTVKNHPLFCNNYSVDEIKRRLKRDYYFKNDVNTIVFIGFSLSPNARPIIPQNPDQGQNQRQQQRQAQEQQPGQNQGQNPGQPVKDQRQEQNPGQLQRTQQNNEGKPKNKAEMMPFSTGGDQLAPPSDGNYDIGRLFLLLLGISFLAGGISWRKNRNSADEKLV